jgi:AcrR family transcriptional regulator
MGFSVDEVARRTRVSKATIYRHWPRGIELAIEAWGQHVTTRLPTFSTGAIVADLRDQMFRLAAFYRGPEGVVIAQLLGASAGDDAAIEMVRERFFGPRRRMTVALVEDGVRSGALRSALPAELVVDALFGPIVFRILNGQGALTEAETGQLADVLLNTLQLSDTERPSALE